MIQGIGEAVYKGVIALVITALLIGTCSGVVGSCVYTRYRGYRIRIERTEAK